MRRLLPFLVVCCLFALIDRTNVGMAFWRAGDADARCLPATRNSTHAKPI